MVSLTLDRTGRLVSLLAVPVQTTTTQGAPIASAPASAADWTAAVRGGRPADRTVLSRRSRDGSRRSSRTRGQRGRARIPIAATCRFGSRRRPCWESRSTSRSSRRGPGRRTKTVRSGNTSGERVGLSTCAPPWRRWPLRSPCCWRCAICVSAAAIAAARCG